MKFWKRLLVALLCAVLLSTCALAGEISPNKVCELTVQCKHKAEGVTFAIWRVAKVSDNVRFTKIDEFKDARVNVNDFDNWDDAAETLAGFVASRGIEPLEMDDTNSQGKAFFDTLKTGLYLVVGESYTYNGKTYEQYPFLVALPTRSDNTKPWDYDVIATQKAVERVEPPAEKVEVSVTKIWSGDDDSLVRPVSITVYLLCDGAVYDSVTLNRRNNWTYIWQGLPADHLWRVSEAQVPQDYTVLVHRNGNDFVIVNTYDRPEEYEEIPDDDVPLDKPKLPETGTLQWIVPLLLGAGAVLFLLGLLRRRREG